MSRGRSGGLAHPRQDRQGPQDRLDPLARAAAQRSLCEARQGRGLSLARRLQADRARRALRLPEGRRSGSSTSASRRAAGPRSCASGCRRPRSSASTCCRPTRSTARRSCRWTSWTTRRPTGCKEALGGPADLVLSDMAANTVGHPQTDHLRTMGLVEAALDFAAEVLRPGGAFVAKVLAGGADSEPGRRAQAPLHRPSSTPSRRPAARARPNGMSWRRGSRRSSHPGEPGLMNIGGIAANAGHHPIRVHEFQLSPE